MLQPFEGQLLFSSEGGERPHGNKAQNAGAELFAGIDSDGDGRLGGTARRAFAVLFNVKGTLRIVSQC